ncbi:MAG: rhomboid family intramembrane serine protease, partial [Actinomycetota bacterium]
TLRACPGMPLEAKSVIASMFTSMFLHGGLLHLGGNMLFLWVFGNNIEDVLGKVRYVVFYLLAGLAATMAHVLANPASEVPTVGASGAISGLLGAYLILFPHAQVTTLVPLFIFIQFMQLPAIVVLALWFVSQFFIGAGQQAGGAGVAWVAHVGGFVAGMILIFLLGGWAKRQREKRTGFG